MARGNQRDRSKERFWRRLLRLWRRSGLTIRDFCREYAVSEPSFCAWRRTIAEHNQQTQHRRTSRRNRKPRTDDTPAFLPVQVITPATPLPCVPLEVVLAPERFVRVPSGFDPATLRQLLAVLQESSC